MTAISNESAMKIHIPVEEMTDSRCPKCGSFEVTGEFVETSDGIASQEVSCGECGERWKNVYDFAAVYLIDEGEDGLLIEVRADAKKVEESASGDEIAGALRTKLEALRTANENLRFELEVAYGQNADLERRIDELQKS